MNQIASVLAGLRRYATGKNLDGTLGRGVLSPRSRISSGDQTWQNSFLDIMYMLLFDMSFLVSTNAIQPSTVINAFVVLLMVQEHVFRVPRTHVGNPTEMLT